MQATLNTSCGAVRLRPTRAEDAAAYRDLRLEALWMHPEAFSSDHADSATRAMDWWAERARLGSGETNQICYVAQNAQNELVAMCGVYREEGVKVHHTGHVWGMYVRPAWRGLKIAAALLEMCEAWAREKGVHILRLAVVTDNAPAIRCYQRRGFVTYGTAPQAICINGGYHDELLMAKPLAPVDRSPGGKG